MKRGLKQGPFWEGLKAGLPIGLGYLSVAFTFGMKAVADGMVYWQPVVMSFLTTTSAGQFAALPMMLGLKPLAEVALTQLVINLRYALMSLTLSTRLDGTINTLDRLIIAMVNTDEVFAVAASKPVPIKKGYLYGLIVLPWLGWGVGTALGAVAGALMPLALRQALGIAIYGLFFAIFLPPARLSKAVGLVVLVAAVIRTALYYLSGLSSGMAVIICGVIAAAIGAALHPIKEAR